MSTPTVREVQPASTAMNTLASMMKQFLDNVNAGKFVTDVGPGLALTVPLLMLLTVLTDSQLLPLQQAPHLRAQYRAHYEEIEDELTKLAATLPTELKSEIGSGLPSAQANPNHLPPVRWDRAERIAGQALAAKGKELTKAQREYNAVATTGNAENVEKITAEQKKLEKRIAEFKDRRTQLATVRTDYVEATSVTKNLQVWETNLALVASLAVVLGVMISQAARFVFFEFIFRFPFKKEWRALRGKNGANNARLAQLQEDDKDDLQRTKTALLKQRSPSFAAAYQDLVTNHLRYAEGAVNMAMPVLLFGWVYPCFAHPFLSTTPDKPDHPCDLIDVPVACWIIAACMIGSGWVTYLRFRAKEREWLRQNLDDIAVAEATTAAINAANQSTTAARSAEESAKVAKQHADRLSAAIADVNALKKNAEEKP